MGERMIHIKKRYLYIILLLITIFAGGCGLTNTKKDEIKQSFEKILGMYPIKNLEELYDKEGYRDEEFDKNDKGMWILNSQMSIQRKGEDLESRGMVLYINRNTKTTNGFYSVEKYYIDKNGYAKSNEKEYPVKMVNNKIIPTKPIHDKQIKKEIEEFKLFAQYANFKDLNHYKNGKVSYNPKVSSYTVKYQLTNNDYNVKQLRERYDIPTDKAPKLTLKGVGDIKGSSFDYHSLEFTFVQNEEESIFFSDGINFTTSKRD